MHGDMPADAVFKINEIAILNHLSDHPNQPAPKNVANRLKACGQLEARWNGHGVDSERSQRIG
jgi:hypothetical protein